MWVVRWVLVFILMIVLLGFSVQNLDQTVTITFWKYQMVDVPYIISLFMAFIAGAAIWFLFSVFQILQLKTEMRGVRKGKAQVEKELADLRNMSIEESSHNAELEESESTD